MSNRAQVDGSKRNAHVTVWRNHHACREIGFIRDVDAQGISILNCTGILSLADGNIEAHHSEQNRNESKSPDGGMLAPTQILSKFYLAGKSWKARAFSRPFTEVLERVHPRLSKVT